MECFCAFAFLDSQESHPHAISGFRVHFTFTYNSCWHPNNCQAHTPPRVNPPIVHPGHGYGHVVPTTAAAGPASERHVNAGPGPIGEGYADRGLQKAAAGGKAALQVNRVGSRDLQGRGK